MPEISSAEGKQRVLDEEGDEITEDGEYDASKLIYPFELWEPAILEGNAYQVGLPALEVQSAWIKRRLPTFGGDLTKWLLPRAVELEKEANPQADGKQVYGWLPPPLLGEGNKVQTEWLYEFLLEPHKIRPAVLMRMPKFNMSSQEATDLANYFAAKDNASYPYEADPATDLGRLREEDAKYREQVQATPEAERPRGDGRFDHVMNIVTSSNYCVQCHIVGDFEPKTSDRAKAPDLSVVNARLRPDYLKRWIANPKQILPYTPMPVNVKYNAQDPKFLGGVEQKLYRGTSLEQLDALVDLLMNYQVYTKERAPVAELVPTAPAAAPGASTTTAESSTSSEAEGSEEVQ
jgi:cbb3-type cytochrome oxidase cytochrome c subunit